jgi:phosphonoacetaldehyde hydrolase
MGEGRSAGCWAVGVAASGNGVGLTAAELQALEEPDRRDRIRRAGDQLEGAGAHIVIDTVADLPVALADIEQRVERGETP